LGKIAFEKNSFPRKIFGEKNFCKKKFLEVVSSSGLKLEEIEIFLPKWVKVWWVDK